MIELPSRERVAEAMTFAHITESDGDLLVEIAELYVTGRLRDWEAIEIIGWFDPQSKRFCYTDEKEYQPERFTGYTNQVAALGVTDEHEHDWIDARNEVVREGRYCRICGKIKVDR